MADERGAGPTLRTSGIRSPMLAALPRPSTEGRRKRVTWRGTVFVLVGGALLLAVLIVAGRLAPRDDVLGLLLYGLHDEVYLPIKGYAYTALLPVSMIWWGFAALLLTLVLASLLADRSFLRRPHASLTRWLVGLPLMTGWLVAGARWMRRRHLPCDLLRQVAAYEQETATRRLLMTPGQGTNATRHAVRVTALAIRLYLLPPTGPGVAVQVAACWVRGLLVARLQRHDELTGPLLDLAPLMSDSLRDAHVLASRLGSADEGFTLAALARDVERLAEVERRLLRAAQSVQDRGENRRDRQRALAEAVPRSRLRELAVSVDVRRAVLEQARGMVETRRLYARSGIGGAGETLANSLPELPAVGLALVGQMALDVALLVADLGQAPTLAQASLEAVEALALSLELHAALQQERQPMPGARPAVSPIEVTLIGLVEGLPRPEQYAVCSRLGAADPHGRVAAWTARATASGVVQPGDLALARDRQTALQLAGGPDA